ncbi:hypothetical protein ACFSQQ_16410 [Mesorhizobium kowhaii]|uniref:hypothetical protein n=1 Tax=Mesorhizobium kowhaii TaxID=1300272 RepID=UPI0035EEB138
MSRVHITKGQAEAFVTMCLQPVADDLTDTAYNSDMRLCRADQWFAAEAEMKYLEAKLTLQHRRMTYLRCAQRP